VRRFGRISNLRREVRHKFRPLVMQFPTESSDHSTVHIIKARHRAPSNGLQYYDTPVGTKPQTVYYTYFSPFIIYSSDDVITASPPPPIRRVTLHSPFSSHFTPPFSSTFTSFYKISLAPGLLVPNAFLSTPIHA